MTRPFSTCQRSFTWRCTRSDVKLSSHLLFIVTYRILKCCLYKDYYHIGFCKWQNAPQFFSTSGAWLKGSWRTGTFPAYPLGEQGGKARKKFFCAKTVRARIPWLTGGLGAWYAIQWGKTILSPHFIVAMEGYCVLCGVMLLSLQRLSILCVLGSFAYSCSRSCR